MTRMTGLRRVATMVASLAVFSGCGAAVDKAGGPTQPPAPIRLTVANTFGLDSVQNFKKELESASAGRLQLDITSMVGAQTPVAEALAIEQVRSGTADMGVVGSRAWPTAGVTSYDALLAPFLIDSYGLEQKVLESSLVDDMATGLEPLGLVAIGVLPGDLRVVLSRTRAFDRPAAFVGATVAISKSAVADMTYQALGATATAIGAGAPVDPFDAVETPVVAISGNGYDAVDKLVAANVRMWPRPIVIFMSNASFDRLTTAQQAMLRAASRAAIAQTVEDLQHGELEAAATSCRRGVRFGAASGENLAALRAAVEPVYRRLEGDPLTGRAIAAINDMKIAANLDEPPLTCGGTSSPTAGPSGSPPASKASHQTSPIEGAWETCPTEEEIVAAGGAPGEALANAGCTTLMFAGGVFSERGASAATLTPGTYVLAGDTMTINRSNGEVFDFGWSVFKDTLTLTRSKIAGAVSPAPWLASPFHRRGG